MQLIHLFSVTLMLDIVLCHLKVTTHSIFGEYLRATSKVFGDSQGPGSSDSTSLTHIQNTFSYHRDMLCYPIPLIVLNSAAIQETGEGDQKKSIAPVLTSVFSQQATYTKKGSESVAVTALLAFILSLLLITSESATQISPEASHLRWNPKHINHPCQKGSP